MCLKYIYIYQCANKGYTKCQKTSLQSKKGPKILRKKKEKKTFQKSAEMSQKSATKVFFLNISKKTLEHVPKNARKWQKAQEKLHSRAKTYNNRIVCEIGRNQQKYKKAKNSKKKVQKQNS